MEIYQVIKYMYNNVKVCVKIGDKKTDFFQTNIRIKQGYVMSPTLFNLFINDMTDKLGVDEYTPVLANQNINCYNMLMILYYCRHR